MSGNLPPKWSANQKESWDPLFCPSTGHEYLHKSNGSVYRHNVNTGEVTEFLSKDKFVSRTYKT